jgi:hypothetical protein
MSFEKEKVVPGLICENDLHKLREAVCIKAEKIYDSCKEKDCVENAKVFFKHPEYVQKLIDKAINIKAKRAEILDVFTNTEKVPFKRGFFTVDVKFFIKVEFELFIPHKNFSTKIVCINGLITFDKKVILFGSEGSVKVFKTIGEPCCDDENFSTMVSDNNPTAIVEVATPIALGARLFEECECEEECHRCCHECAPTCTVSKFGDDIIGNLDEELFEECEHEHHKKKKRVVATVGLFSIVKLVRDVQLLIPAFDFCIPHKKCIASTEKHPCELFRTLEFPIHEFFPPQKFDFPEAEEEEERMRKEFDRKEDCCKNEDIDDFCFECGRRKEECRCEKEKHEEKKINRR